MEEAGYKDEGDLIGSSFDVGAHVTTIFSKELSENYEQIVQTHNTFISKAPNASLKPVCIEYGFPKTGRLSKAVVIDVHSPEIDAYRKACGLGELFPPAQLSIFSKEIKPLQELDGVTFLQFVDKKTTYLNRLNEIFKSNYN